VVLRRPNVTRKAYSPESLRDFAEIAATRANSRAKLPRSLTEIRRWFLAARFEQSPRVRFGSSNFGSTINWLDHSAREHEEQHAAPLRRKRSRLYVRVY
jgi:hypothetical protein